MKDTLLKGAQRRIVVVKSKDSKLFEEACFLMRENQEDLPMENLIEEANRIVEKSCVPLPKKGGKRRNWQFLAGLLVGAAIESLGMAVIFLFM